MISMACGANEELAASSSMPPVYFVASQGKLDGSRASRLSCSILGDNQLPGLKVRETEPYESAIRRFKKQCEKAGILSEIRKREHYEKPSVKRKKKALAAKKRALKKARKGMM